MKASEKEHAVTLDRPPPLNPIRSIVVAVAVCIALAVAVYFAVVTG